MRTLELRKYTVLLRKNRKQNDLEMETNHLQMKVKNIILSQKWLNLLVHFFKVWMFPCSHISILINLFVLLFIYQALLSFILCIFTQHLLGVIHADYFAISWGGDFEILFTENR